MGGQIPYHAAVTTHATFAGVGPVPHQKEALSKGLHYKTSVAEAVFMVIEVGQMMESPLVVLHLQAEICCPSVCSIHA